MTLAAHDLSLSLGRRPVLHRIDFAARPGTLTAIVGPNGSGKTTLLRALTGELAAERRVTLDGRALEDWPPAALARRRAVLPQSVTLAFPFTVLEIVKLGCEVRGVSGDTPALDALAAVGLAAHVGRPCQQLSGGEQQRAQLARVLAQVGGPSGVEGPNWLLLDEPVSALDIGHQLAVMRLARDFAAGGGGVVAVMHDLNLTAMFADRVVLMESGRLAAEGAPAEVLTSDRLSQVYACPLQVGKAPAEGPFILPQSAA
ncbi:MAG: heme ABC transporter ATP-binding protein [Paracoccus sp. (in: a-proteobacteria)]|nr:heme ABC transporter ATP-binding protein [Paracoccus sp. (in: a-proteobacteria)]MDO5371806.1 heme ABC transporter ATP-binding protein [Paracoccus sp. (in: a-proteobacteria)]